MSADLLYNLVDKLSPHCRDLAQLRDVIEGVLDDYTIQPKQRGIALNGNVYDMVRLYLISKRVEGLTPGTLANYETHLGRLSAMCPMNVSEITVNHLRQFLAMYTLGLKVKDSTLSTVTGVLKGFFGWLVDNEYLTKDPTKPLKTPKVGKRLRSALSVEQLERMRDACCTAREQAMLELFFASGCRLAEVQQLNVGSLDWADMSIRVIGKGNKQRKVYFSTKAKILLQKYLSTRPEACLDDPLFTTDRLPSRRLSPPGIRRTIKRIAAHAHIDQSVYPHLLRHTNATHSLKSGVPITTIQALLGHAHLDTTMVYAEVDSGAVKFEYMKHMS